MTLTDKVRSQGTHPTSISIHHQGGDEANLVYVLNNGTAVTPGNIAAFRLSGDGMLKHHIRLCRAFSGSNVSAAEVSFNAAGTVLIVTEKMTGLIDTYTVNSDGKASGPIMTPSRGSTPRLGFQSTASTM